MPRRASGSRRALTDAMETATKGKVVGQVLDGLKAFDITLTIDDRHRTDPTKLEEVRLVSPTGAIVLLRDVAEVVERLGPNEVARENLRRRIVVQCNVRGRDLGSTVEELQKSIATDVKLPQGYTLVYGGLYEAQQESTRLLLLLGGWIAGRDLRHPLHALSLGHGRDPDHA